MHRRAGQAAIDAREVTYGMVDTKLRMMQIPIPDPLDQLWDLLRQAPSHYQRIHLACSPSGHNDPGALRQHSAIMWLPCHQDPYAVFRVCAASLAAQLP